MIKNLIWNAIIKVDHLPIINHWHIHRAQGIDRSAVIEADAGNALAILEYPLAIGWNVAFQLICSIQSKYLVRHFSFANLQQNRNPGFWTYVKIFSNWLRSDVPGNKARRENNSAIIQAELHMSTALLYDWFSNTSGARYHSVTTCRIDMRVISTIFNE